MDALEECSWLVKEYQSSDLWKKVHPKVLSYTSSKAENWQRKELAELEALVTKGDRAKISKKYEEVCEALEWTLKR